MQKPKIVIRHPHTHVTHSDRQPRFKNFKQILIALGIGNVIATYMLAGYVILLGLQSKRICIYANEYGEAVPEFILWLILLFPTIYMVHKLATWTKKELGFL